MSRILVTAATHQCSTRHVNSAITCAALSSREALVAITCNQEKSVLICRVEDGNCAMTFEGHNDFVTSVAFSPDGLHLISGSADKTAKVFRVADGSCVATLAEHSDRVTSVAVDRSASTIATGSWDTTTKLWRVVDGSCVSTLTGHNNGVTSVAFSPDGKMVVTGSLDNTAKLWDTERGGCVTLTGHTLLVSSVAFSSNGKLIATASWDATVRLWSADDGKCVATLAGHCSFVTSVAFNHEGTLLASGSSDCSTKVWSTQSRACLSTLTGHIDVVTSVGFSSHANQLVTGSRDTSVRVWSLNDVVQDPVPLRTNLLVTHGHQSHVKAIAYSPDGTLIATGSFDNTAKLWRVADGLCIATLSGHTDTVSSASFTSDNCALVTGSWDKTAKLWRFDDDVACAATLTGHSGKVMSVATSPDGARVATSSWDKSVKLWNLVGECTATLAGHNSFVSSVAFSPDSAMLASGSQDETVRLWRVSDGSCTATLTGHSSYVTSVVFSPDGTTVAAGKSSSTIELWRIADEVRVATLAGHTDAVTSAAFSPDGTVVASGSRDATAKLWTLDGVCTATCAGHSDAVNSVAFSPDGALIATASKDTSSKIWSAAAGTCVATLAGHATTATAAAISPDLAVVATGHQDCAKLWRVADGGCAPILVKHTAAVNCVAFSPDGSLLATGSADTTACLWRVVDGVSVGTLRGHEGSVTSVTFNTTGALLATCSEGTVNLWRVSDGVCHATLEGHSRLVHLVAFSPDDTMIATGSRDRTVKLWRLTNGECTATLSGHADDVICVAFRADSSLVATAAADKSVSLWRSVDGILVGASTFSVVAEALLFDDEGERLAIKRNNVTVGHLLYSPTERRISDILQRFISVRRSNLIEGTEIRCGKLAKVSTVVWRKTQYALKIFHPHVFQSDVDRSRLAVATYLQHPNIVRVVAVVTDDNDPLLPVGLLMELAQQSITDAIAALHPTTSTVAKWLCELAQAIEFAHHCGVVHTNIKPDNVLMASNGDSQLTAKLTDFGSSFVLSTTKSNATQERFTQLFVAPEYTAMKTGLTKEVDVFSFGMTMWCILCPPGTDHGLGMTSGSLRKSFREGKRPPLDGISAPFAKLIARCWQDEWTARPQMNDVVDALREATAIVSTFRPDMLVWSSFFAHVHLERAFDNLQFTMDNGVLLSEPVAPNNPCYEFVCQAAGPEFIAASARDIQMVGLRHEETSGFKIRHTAEAASLAANVSLHSKRNPAGALAALRRLEAAFVPIPPADVVHSASPLARVILAWHTTSPERVVSVCRDGPRPPPPKHCYFGSGSYFALEADYAARRRANEVADGGERALVLFAISVSQVKVVTIEDYAQPSENPRTPFGFSKFYEGEDTAAALAPLYDAHFVPVKPYGMTHPATGCATRKDVGYQAAEEASGEAEGHELVVSSRHRCVPLAIVCLKKAA